MTETERLRSALDAIAVIARTPPQREPDLVILRLAEAALAAPPSPERGLEEALREAEELLQLCDPEGQRAQHIQAPEDTEVRDLCERVGYGAVMDSASRQWRLRDRFGAMGAHTVGPCVGSVIDGLKMVRAFLKENDK